MNVGIQPSLLLLFSCIPKSDSLDYQKDSGLRVLIGICQFSLIWWSLNVALPDDETLALSPPRALREDNCSVIAQKY